MFWCIQESCKSPIYLEYVLMRIYKTEIKSTMLRDLILKRLALILFVQTEFNIFVQ